MRAHSVRAGLDLTDHYTARQGAGVFPGGGDAQHPELDVVLGIQRQVPLGSPPTDNSADIPLRGSQHIDSSIESHSSYQCNKTLHCSRSSPCQERSMQPGQYCFRQIRCCGAGYRDTDPGCRAAREPPLFHDQSPNILESDAVDKCSLPSLLWLRRPYRHLGQGQEIWHHLVFLPRLKDSSKASGNRESNSAKARNCSSVNFTVSPPS